jgi:hypothetical protein
MTSNSSLMTSSSLPRPPDLNRSFVFSNT